jgi:hypothetical protein
VPGSALWRLQNGLRAKRLSQFSDGFRLVADNGNELRGLQRLARANDVLEQRTSSGAVQNFGEFGTHARPFPRGKNHENCVGSGWHAKNIVAFKMRFGNLRDALLGAEVP